MKKLLQFLLFFVIFFTGFIIFIHWKYDRLLKYKYSITIPQGRWNKIYYFDDYKSYDGCVTIYNAQDDDHRMYDNLNVCGTYIIEQKN